MDLLPFHFRTCQFCGMWSNDDNFLYIPKLIYRSIILFILAQYTLGQLLEGLTMQGTVDEFTALFTETFTYVALCLKVLNFISRKEEMCSILDDFRLPFCQPKSAEEQEIINKHSSTVNKMFLSILILSQSTGIVMIIIPIVVFGGSNSTIPLRTYHPYDTSKTINYWIAFTLQTLAPIYGIFLNVSMDNMVYGFIIMITAQYEINCRRIANAVVSLKESIDHHVSIKHTVWKIQDYFICVIVPLFSFSLITLCANIFQLSRKGVTSAESLFLIMYLICMLLQIFLYCWYGNELDLKAKEVTDAIYFSDWTEYTTKERKNMYFVMLSSQTDSCISFHGQCKLTIDTFIWIIKTSYASFNLLQCI